MLIRNALLGVGALGALGFFAHSIIDARRQSREAQAEIIEMREAMTELRRAVGRGDRLDVAGSLGRAQVVPSRDGDRDPMLDGAGDDDGGEGRAETAIAARAPTQQVLPVDEEMLHAEQALAREGVDSAWASATTLSVERTLDKIIPAGSSLQSLQCRTTRCRLELQMRDEPSLESFQREALYGADVLWSGRMMMKREARPDGSITMVAHLLR